MNVKVVGKKMFTTSKGSNVYILYVNYVQKGVQGEVATYGFSNENCYNKVETGKEYDLAIFFKGNITNIYLKKGDKEND